MKKILLLSIIFINIGCAQKSPLELSQEGPTMQQTYNKHVSGSLSHSNSSLPYSYKRLVGEDINNVDLKHYASRRAANPELKMYVYQHRLKGRSAIVSGYTVSFPMYNTVHYGLKRDFIDGN